MIDIKKYTFQTVQKKTKTGRNEYGKPITAAAQDVKCRIVTKRKNMRDKQGNEYVIDAEMWADAKESFTLEDIIAYSGVNYKIVEIRTLRTLKNEENHKKIFLRKTEDYE